MIDVVAFELSHLKRFYSKFPYENLERDMSKSIMEKHKTIMTLIWKEKILAIVGVTELRPGAGELWLLPSVYVDYCKLSFFKYVRSLIYNFAFPEMNFHRLEIAILKGWDKGMKWAKTLGFKESHTCEAYDQFYRDHVIFYKVKSWQ